MKITVMTLHGYSGSGKDSTYQALRAINTTLPRVSFGDLLREEIYKEWGVDAHRVGDERKTRNYRTPEGTTIDTTFKDIMVAWGRQKTLVDPFHYTHNIVEAIKTAAITRANPLVVVTDCRRLHELRAIRAQFETYSFWLEYEHATPKPLDRILEWDESIHTLDEGTIQENVDQIIEYMIRNLPHPIKPIKVS